jgi:hypothetical protein
MPHIRLQEPHPSSPLSVPSSPSPLLSPSSKLILEKYQEPGTTPRELDAYVRTISGRTLPLDYKASSGDPTWLLLFHEMGNPILFH